MSCLPVRAIYQSIVIYRVLLSTAIIRLQKGSLTKCASNEFETVLESVILHRLSGVNFKENVRQFRR